MKTHPLWSRPHGSILSRRDALAVLAIAVASRPAFARADVRSHPSVKADATNTAKPPPPPSPPRLWTILPPTPELPRQAEQVTLDINGTRIFYARLGSGPPVILLHGGMGNSNYWGRQMAHLSERFSVVAMDTRGHGRSPLTTSAFGYGLFAQDVVALMDALGMSKAAIVGWSDGAITGLELAMNHAARVDRLFAFGGNVWRSAMRWGGPRRTFFDYAKRCKEEYATLSPDPGRWPELKAGLRSMWHLAPEYSASELARIAAPTVIADAAYDEIIKPIHAAQTAAMIRSARPLLLPNASHFAMLQDPEGFDAALDRFMVMPPSRMPGAAGHE